ncbi:glycerophosphoinositol inositolphosphodiesterase GDPD2 [Mirounga angustirostris]|uniref:Glycerophosphoinositol inositolphosphodiesterase GDPD2 isoform X1 n=3 Tax=Phocidae TaxID=9709 RepID=A0A2U3Y1M0_LEPWE|nr:glycerophosphoinositol inositolphosphodiesterase GDPD2 isoform X1 [Leptonychotes weddellii]XP_021536056.1 glycerophosphoinositol inositolphosphodiesterase GDPD2 isoform X2 [Neomonachus schauinslandi]XP_032249756.1 glycerophosphoinositol inositolphosphodiesterase GDPD2 isoform X1 [Phoca vitulina]XP_034884590.1 LOW QUALITY PROTEIN: glycerophosphoinositol inositolphosphodiesterase GDPD2 [Mirounga leonina]XP_035922021.1 glycerophosphoinositol inositolphosphodiesterase GDPD2 isoform X1 [Halichoer
MAESPGCCSVWARCLHCLYSCHWRKCPKERMQTSKCDCIWFGLLFLTFLLSLGWLYIGLILLNDLHNFNEFLFHHWGHWMDWSLAFLLVISLLVTYASLLLLLALLLRLCGQPLHLHSVHKMLLLLIMLLVAAGLVGLDVQWQQEWRSLRLSLQATAPFLHIGAVAGVTLLAWPVAATFYRVRRRGPKTLLLFLFFGVSLAVYLAPLCISSPCIMEPRDLPPKPGLVGHRGAPMLAPENTLMSLRKTAECGAAVFETDVMVSSDGIPFLMHDEHLSRTTDVASVFPARTSSHSSDFSCAELKKLNAGTWFLERQPFWGAKRLSGPDRKEAENQSVPTLEELLKEAAVLNLSIMFDLRRPPRNHTYHDTFVNQTLETVLSARVPQAMVLWLPDEDRANVQQRAPRMRQIYGQQGSNRTERPQFLNLPYQDLPLLDIKALHQDNVSVNLFVVNKPWLFSLLWCAGVDSVTTNDCQLLQQMRYPVWIIPPQTYLMMWIITNCVSTLLLLWTFLLQGRCKKEREKTGLETAVLLTRINNFIME